MINKEDAIKLLTERLNFAKTEYSGVADDYKESLEMAIEALSASRSDTLVYEGMKVKDGKIIEMTESKAYSRWLYSGWDEVCDFKEYIERLEDAGCKITEKDGEKG